MDYMNSSANEALALIQESARNFAEKHIRPEMMDWDERQYFPKDLFQKMGEQGFMGVLVPEEYGGTGLGYQEYITVIEEVAQVCSSIGLSLAAHNSLGTNHILMFGNEEQKKKYLPKLASGEHVAFWGLTEANTGSDAMRMQCTAEKDGDYYVINGTKNWITHGISGDVGVVLVRTGDLLDSRGISAFVIERNMEGFSAGKKENKLGMRASETAELVFENCRVHKSQLLGNEGEGFIQAMKILDGGRISIAALSLGIAKGAYKAALKYSKEREQFGKAISKFQAIAFKLADMATEIEAAELLTRKAGYLKDNHLPVTKISAMAKYMASEVCVKVATDSIQVHGGYGYTKDFPVEKFFRDSKLCTIGEGTSEIQKLVISRSLLKD
ncbi:acyl-CoA dehydrogenase domain-containing protein [Saprospira grandis str. Lewin]|uniref:Cyclohex-1-ene-1-carbonyl-CoA dehydrogenase n=2 Tax=Saprospira TaxID=1007 RepID=H6L3S7_SAPGL|nr:acyl-CoA dehydrogenase family protein [Saprospira grandis]AFC22762.1 acyl-CoA dehydrogenase domain-containing protein [Saprospira grandis str. Lewin]